MAFNPFNLLQLKGKYQVFKQEHPEMPEFGKTLNQKGLKKGCVYQIRVTTPDGEVLEQAITLTDNDVEIVRLFVS